MLSVPFIIHRCQSLASHCNALSTAKCVPGGPKCVPGNWHSAPQDAITSLVIVWRQLCKLSLVRGKPMASLLSSTAPLFNLFCPLMQSSLTKRLLRFSAADSWGSWICIARCYGVSEWVKFIQFPKWPLSYYEYWVMLEIINPVLFVLQAKRGGNCHGSWGWRLGHTELLSSCVSLCVGLYVRLVCVCVYVCVYIRLVRGWSVCLYM